tara:strand:+ start:46 stop:429 length:384 start_codon:yes stop_codon:yes gene_type:complete
MGESIMTYSQNANPNPTNSEMDSKTILKPELTDSQRNELIERYTEIVVDGMDMKSLVLYAQEQMANYFDALSDVELREDVGNYDEELYDELVDNIVSDDEEKEIQRLMEYTNDDIIVIDSPNSPLFP